MTAAALGRLGASARGVDPKTAVAVVALGGPLVASVTLAFRSGGFFVSSWGIACIALLALTAFAAMTAGGSFGGWMGGVAISGWAVLAAWQGLSMLWADDPSRARDTMGLTLLYAAALTLGVLGLRRTAWLGRLAGGALAVAAVVVGAGVAARLRPGFGDDPTAQLSWPTGYWNALGVLAAFGITLAVGFGTAKSIPMIVRGVALALTPLLALGLLMTLSRGSFVALGFGIAFLIVFAPGRLETLTGGILTLAVSAPLWGYANAQDGLVALQGPLSDHASAGARVGLLTIAAMVVVGVGGALAVRLVARMGERTRTATGIAAAGVGAIVVLVALVVAWPTGGPLAAADRQFDSFREFAPGERGKSDSLSDRLAVAAGSGRWQQWEVAGTEFSSAPIAGTGAGDFVFKWNQERDIDISVQNAHSLYLEVLAESGMIGLLFLLTPIVVGAVAISTARFGRAPPDLRRDLSVASAAVTVVLVHAGIDWDWQLPAVVLPAVVLGAGATKAALLCSPEGAEHPPAPPVGQASIALVCLLGIALVLGPTLAARDVEEARRLARSGDVTRALSAAKDAGRRDPQSAEPLLLQANLLSDLGRMTEADASFAAAIARSPRNWVILADWAVSLDRRGRGAEARRLVARGLEVNPLEPRLQLLGQRLGIVVE